MLGKVLFFFILFGVASAETRTYLVYRAEHFPQDRYLYTVSPQEFRFFVDSGKKTIGEAGGQPFRMTQYEINYSGKYSLWTVSFKDEEEKWHIDSMERQGYIVLVSSSEVVSRYDPQKGGRVEEMQFASLTELPTDYFEVGISTP